MPNLFIIQVANLEQSRPFTSLPRGPHTHVVLMVKSAHSLSPEYGAAEQMTDALWKYGGGQDSSAKMTGNILPSEPPSPLMHSVWGNFHPDETRYAGMGLFGWGLI